MIRVMNFKPGLYFVQGHNDMSHYHPSHWTVGSYTYWLTDDQYIKFLAFTEPSLKKEPKPEEVGGLGATLEQILGSSYAERVKRALALNPGGNQIWEFNALKNLRASETEDAEYIRSCVLFAERNFFVPTWFDHVRLSVCNVLCRFLNYTNKWRVQRELARWDEFLEKMHSKRSGAT